MKKLSTLALAVAASLAVVPAAFARDDNHNDQKNIRSEYVRVRPEDRDHTRLDERHQKTTRDDRYMSHDRDNH